MNATNVLTCFLFVAAMSQAEAQWEQTNGPFGSATDFAVIGTNLFASTSSGVFLSTNDGASWHAVSSGLTSTEVSILAVI